MADSILEEHSGPVTILRLNNPAALNALTSETAAELAAMLHEASRTARAIVLAGHARAFCSGIALSGNVDPADPDFDAGAPLHSAFNPLMCTIKESPIPMVSAVRGAAAGVGASIALACDMIVAGEGAYFLQAFRRIGLVPDGGAAFLLAHSIGRVRAMELKLLGEKLSAARALEWGLINRLVADQDVERLALDIAVSLANGPTYALSLIRKAAWAALSSDWESQLSLERDLQHAAGQHPDHAEGVAAFIEKRAPDFVKPVQLRHRF
jgi:2-(1,2-epoxy-1,2-dihydrophenyl)acetyl-CoA isomerase